MERSRLFGWFDWEDDTSTVASLTCIIEPRKPLKEYQEGETIRGRVPGYRGQWKGVIRMIRGSRNEVVQAMECSTTSDTQTMHESTSERKSSKSKKKSSVKNQSSTSMTTVSRVPSVSDIASKAQKRKAEEMLSRQRKANSPVEQPVLDYESSTSYDYDTPTPTREITRPFVSRCLSAPSSVGVDICSITTPRTLPVPHMSLEENRAMPRVSAVLQGSRNQKRSSLLDDDERQATPSTPPSVSSISEGSRKRFRSSSLDDENCQATASHVDHSRCDERIKKLKKRITSLETDLDSLWQKVAKLKDHVKKVREVKPAASDELEIYGDKTKGELRDLIKHEIKISSACKLLMFTLFDKEYIREHCITGRAGNKWGPSRPMMDERRTSLLKFLLTEKFGKECTTLAVINEKIQNVIKSVRSQK